MAQHDYDIANADGATVRADLNSVLSAIVSQNSGTAAPPTTFAHMLWADTTNSLLKQRNAANSAWVTVGTLGSANLGLLPASGYTQGNTFYANASGVVTALAAGTAGYSLFAGGAGANPAWGESVKVGSFTRDISLATGNQSITGVGFKPRAVVLLLGGSGGTSTLSAGFSDAAGAGCFANNYGGTGGTFATLPNAAFAIAAGGAGANYASAGVLTMDSDGFTIPWTKAGSPTGTVTVYYLALR